MAETVDVAPSWNMIGSISRPVLTAAIVQDPLSIVRSLYFGYDGGYFSADTLQPGRAYWVKVNRVGKLIVSASSAAALNKIRIVQTDELPPPPPGESSNNPGLPGECALEQNYPNPFNPKTEFRFQIPEISQVALKVFNILGEEIVTLVNEEKTPGFYSVSWDANERSSGVYFYRLMTKDFVQTKKMLLVK